MADNEVRGELKVLQRLSEYEFGVELAVMRDGVNRNNWSYQNIDQCYKSFLGTPILCAYVGQKIGDGHNMREVRDPKTGQMYYSFRDGTAERIVGTISEDEKDLTLQERDGHTWIVAKGRLWAFYAPELVDKIVRTGRMEVSAETEVLEGHPDGDVEVYTVWRGLGVTILGDDVPPAIPGARIAALAAMQDEFESTKLRAASLKENKPKPKVKGVKRKMSNKQAISRLSPLFEGYRIVGLSEDCMNVALVNAAGNAFSYTFNAEDNGEVIPSRIKPATLSTVYAFDGLEDGVAVDMADIVDFVAQNAASEATETAISEQITTLQAQMDTANQQLATMRANENKRRLQAVKDAVTATLAELRLDSADGQDDEADAIAAEIQGNCERFCSIEEDGCFCGDREASRELMARVMEKRIARNKQARQRSYAWVNPDNNHSDAGGIASVLSAING